MGLITEIKIQDRHLYGNSCAYADPYLSHLKCLQGILGIVIVSQKERNAFVKHI